MIKLSSIVHAPSLQTAYEQDNILNTNTANGNLVISGTEKLVVNTDLQITSGHPIDGYVLTTDASGNASWQFVASGGGSGNVQGPLTSTNNALSRFNGIGGDVLKNSTWILDDTGVLTGGGSLRSVNGSSISPTFSFSNATSTGIYLSTPAPNERLNISIGTQPYFSFVQNAIELLNGNNIATELRLYEPVAGGYNYTGFKAPSLSVDLMYTLPSTSGADGYLLKTNGLGQLSWSNAWYDGYQTVFNEINLTQGSLGSAVDSDGSWVGFNAPNVELLDTALTITDALELLDDGYLSLKNQIASQSLSVVSINSNTSLLVGKTYLVDTTASRVLTLPSPALNGYIAIKDKTGSAPANNITINTSGGLIDGSPNKILNTSYGAWSLVSDGSNWYLIASY
jgi:hypothetical protein